MALPRKPEYERNPLRVLRELLSPRGKKHPISQEKLSEFIDVPVPTIRAIEAGQRSLTLSVLRQALEGLGVQWDEDRQKWLFVLKIDGEKKQWVWSEKPRPFTYRLFSQYYPSRSIRPANFVHQETEIETKLGNLFGLVPEWQWWSLALRYYDFVEQCWQYYNGDKLRRMWESIDAPSDDERLRMYRERVAEMKRTAPGAAIPEK
jgi:transcriptional regulator with XRE-family HTH domain